MAHSGTVLGFLVKQHKILACLDIVVGQCLRDILLIFCLFSTDMFHDKLGKGDRRSEEGMEGFPLKLLLHTSLDTSLNSAHKIFGLGDSVWN